MFIDSAASRIVVCFYSATILQLIKVGVSIYIATVSYSTTTCNTMIAERMYIHTCGHSKSILIPKSFGIPDSWFVVNQNFHTEMRVSNGGIYVVYHIIIYLVLTTSTSTGFSYREVGTRWLLWLAIE